MTREELIRKFDGIVSNSNDEDLCLKGLDTTEESASPDIILTPKNTHDVSRIVEICRKYKCPLHPVSIGANWGYGSSSMPGDSSVLLDLSQLNTIEVIDADLGIVQIGPGVSQGSLGAFIRENLPEFSFEVTGSGRDSSVLANIFEKGVSFSNRSNRLSLIQNAEIVLGTGEVLHTSGRIHSHPSLTTYGPELISVFQQSGYGIIVSATIQLIRATDGVEVAFVHYASQKEMLEHLPVLRKLLVPPARVGVLKVGNIVRTLGCLINRPKILSDIYQESSNSEDLHSKLSREYGISPWVTTILLRGSNRERRAIKKDLKSIIHAKGSVQYVSRFHLSLLLKLGPIKSLLLGFGSEKKAKMMQFLFDLANDISRDDALEALYWAMPEDIDYTGDPLKDACGCYWLCPKVPFKKEAVADAVSLIAETAFSHQVEPHITLNITSSDYVLMIVNLSYNRKDITQTEAATHCYHELSKTLSEKGYYPYRLGSRADASLYEFDPVYKNSVKALKDIFDPDHIISPGKWGL